MTSTHAQNPLHHPTTTKPLHLSSTDFINPIALQQIQTPLETHKIPRPITPSDLPPVGIFWDYENVRPPKTCDNFAYKIRDFARQFGTIKLFNCYGSVQMMPVNHQVKLNQCGVNCVNATHTGKKDVADMILLVDLFCFLLDVKHTCTIILISGDVDFSVALHKLRDRGHKIVLVLPQNRKTREELMSAAIAKIQWEDLIGIEKKEVVIEDVRKEFVEMKIEGSKKLKKGGQDVQSPKKMKSKFKEAGKGVKISHQESERKSDKKSVNSNECYDWVTTGKCKFGNACKFAHPGVHPGIGNLCREWLATKKCKFGDKCMFEHGNNSLKKGRPVLTGKEPKLEDTDVPAMKQIIAKFKRPIDIGCLADKIIEKLGKSPKRLRAFLERFPQDFKLVPVPCGLQVTLHDMPTQAKKSKQIVPKEQLLDESDIPTIKKLLLQAGRPIDIGNLANRVITRMQKSPKHLKSFLEKYPQHFKLIPIPCGNQVTLTDMPELPEFKKKNDRSELQLSGDDVTVIVEILKKKDGVLEIGHLSNLLKQKLEKSTQGLRNFLQQFPDLFDLEHENNSITVYLKETILWNQNNSLTLDEKPFIGDKPLVVNKMMTVAN